MIKIFFVLLLLGCSMYASAQDEVVDFLSGKSMYNAWCAKCHGEDGRGMVEGLELEAPPPDFTECAFNSSETRSDWTAVIAQGGPARGLSWSMPAWDEAITAEQIGLILEYVKSFCTEPGWPAGELNFRRPSFTEKAFPEDEALLVPLYAHSTVGNSSETKFVFESRIGSRGQWELSVPFTSDYHSSTHGIGDTELLGKYALYDDLPSLFILSAGMEVGVPTGSVSKGLGSGEWTLAPFLAAGKGFGKFSAQSMVKFETTPEGEEKELQYALAVSFQPSDEKFGVVPLLEINGLKSLDEGTHSLFLTPELYIGLTRRGHLALSLGTQFPIAGPKTFDYRVVMFFLWEYLDGGIWW